MAKNITKIRHRPIFRELHRFFKNIFHEWPLSIVILISLVLIYLNYEPHTWYTGWDNLHPEFFYSMNIRRAVFSVWQEYQSLGLLGGMGHASDLIRQLLLFGFASLTHLPNEIHRYLWTFSMLAVGPVGVYFSVRYFLKSKFDPKTLSYASLLGAVFYLLNLATVQYFYTTFESFSTFFGFFPWIIYGSIRYLTTPKLKNFLFLVLILLLAAPAFYIETLFVVLGLTLIPLILTHLISHRLSLRAFFTSAALLLTLLLTQGYWLLPVIFFVFTNGKVGTLAKINLISTPETYARNLEFANFGGIAFLKGFWFKYIDYTGGDKFDFLLSVWRNYLNQPALVIIGLLLFLLVLIGLFYSFKKHLTHAATFIAILFISIFFLSGGGQLVGDKIPLFSELFRSPFTKFSIVLAFSYSIFFSVGSIFLFDVFSFLHYRFTYLITTFTLVLVLIVYTTPAFSGYLVAPTMRLKIPDEYFQTFDFFRDRDPATRIANFPQYTFWGWNFYNWGYRGSGFLWYGIRQPILDRAFDVWEKSGETYYEEISTALYSQDRVKFENTIEKYAVNWLLIDKNVISPGNSDQLYTDELIKLVDSSPKFHLEKNFNDSILIYRTDVSQRTKNFISLSGSETADPHPFQTFSQRPILDWPINSDSVNLNRSFKISEDNSLQIPSYSKTENYLPTEISYRKLDRQLEIKLTPVLPDVTIDGQVNHLNTYPNFIYFTLPANQSGLILNLNDQYFEVQLPQEVITTDTFIPLATLYLPSQRSIPVNLYSDVPAVSYDLQNTFNNAQPYQCFTNKPNRKISKVQDLHTITLIGTDLVGCLSVGIPPAFNPGQLISLQFSYLSTTQTPANANISNQTLGGIASPEPLLTQKSPTFTRIMSKSLNEPMQVNLILEANEVKSSQEISYIDPRVTYHDLLGSTGFVLNTTPASVFNIPSGDHRLTLSLPQIESSYNVQALPEKNNLEGDVHNCDNFNQGKFGRRITPDGFLYDSTNANTCDQLDLKHLPHDTHYLISLDYRYRFGLPMTVCLENHTTHHCDIFERLVKSDSPQLLLQPISNPNESSGYTLHLFNQSFGSRSSENLIRSILVTPFPTDFLESISLNRQGSGQDLSPVENSSHSNEFLYTLSLNTDKDQFVDLYQTRSPYWKALEVTQKDLDLPTWQLIARLPFLYFNHEARVLNPSTTVSWYNSWILPAGDHRLVIFYLPQYLEFLGFAGLALLIPLSFTHLLIKHKKK